MCLTERAFLLSLSAPEDAGGLPVVGHRPARRRMGSPQLSFVEAGGPVHVVDFGGGGPAVVLLDGGTGWLPVAPLLADFARVLVIDLVGSGRTPAAGRDDGVEGQVAMLERLLPQVLPQPAVLVGRGAEGLVALAVAARVPERVSGLVLLDPALPSALRPRDRSGALPPGPRSRVETWVDSVRAPALLLRGARDGVQRVDDTRRLASRRPDWSVAALPSLDAFPLREEPDALVVALREWIVGSAMKAALALAS